VPSPDGRFVAVCQEVPVFDGPEFDVRLEHPDGGVLRELFRMGDAGGCEELAWSADSAALAVSIGDTIRIVDVSWAVAHPEERNTHWFVRMFSFGAEGTFRQASNLAFAGPLELEFRLCDFSLQETQRNGGRIRCRTPARPARLEIPSPLVPGRAS
jgi:hypothetical protein